MYLASPLIKINYKTFTSFTNKKKYILNLKQFYVEKLSTRYCRYIQSLMVLGRYAKCPFLPNAVSPKIFKFISANILLTI